MWKLVGIVLLVSAAACANASSPAASNSTTPTGPPTDLESARAAWQAADVGSYALMIKTECFCAPQNYRVVVAGGGSVQTKAPEDYLPETVDDLFAIIQKGYDEKAVTVDVAYDDVGVPLRIFIDQATNIADEEMGYEVTFEDLS